jgi:hypothetical protein
MRTTIALVMALAASSLAFAEESQRWNQDDGANDLVIHIPWCRGALRMRSPEQPLRKLGSSESKM